MFSVSATSSQPARRSAVIARTMSTDATSMVTLSFRVIVSLGADLRRWVRARAGMPADTARLRSTSPFGRFSGRAIVDHQQATGAPPLTALESPRRRSKPFHREGWVYEEKYDGWRIVAYKDGRNVRLVSRRRVDHTERFSEIASAVRRLPARTLILD